MPTDFSSIRQRYSGKGLKIFDEYVLPTLAAAEASGFWQPGASRKVRAALNKQAVAIAFARVNERKDWRRRDTDEGLLNDIADRRGAYHHEATLRGDDLAFAMKFGVYTRAPQLRDLADKLLPYARGEAEHAALARAAEWVRDFIPIAALVQRLDAARPTPEYVFAQVSPTVYANVGKDMGIDFTTVRAPKIIWHKREFCHPKTQKMLVDFVPVIQWPEGTRHGVSRYASGSSRCEACGHTIKSLNWVPLVADTAEGPVALWVGRDCAATLFGAKINGNAKIERAGRNCGVSEPSSCT